MNADALMFFSNAPIALELYAAFEARVLAAHPDARIDVQKTQIAFSSRYRFAFVSLPRGKANAGAIVVTFGLPTRLASPRVWQATEPYPDRWTHHVVVTDASELDAELMGWIDAAYVFSQGK